jgi:hypothetical protein
VLAVGSNSVALFEQRKSHTALESGCVDLTLLYEKKMRKENGMTKIVLVGLLPPDHPIYKRGLVDRGAAAAEKAGARKAGGAHAEKAAG